MPRILQVRTRHDLDDLLAAGESPAWIVAPDREKQIEHVHIVNFEGTRRIEATFDRARSFRRDDGRLVIRFVDGRIVTCNVRFSSRNPVSYIQSNA